jgi:hypothetical protein
MSFPPQTAASSLENGGGGKGRAGERGEEQLFPSSVTEVSEEAEGGESRGSTGAMGKEKQQLCSRLKFCSLTLSHTIFDFPPDSSSCHELNESQFTESLWLCVKPAFRSRATVSAVRNATT